MSKRIEVPRPAIPEALLASLRRALVRAGTPRWIRPTRKGELGNILRTSYVTDAVTRRLVAVFDEGVSADLAVHAVNALPRLLDELTFLRRLLSSLLASWSSSEFRKVDVIPAMDWVRAKLPKQAPKKQQPLPKKKQQPPKKLPPSKKQQLYKKKVQELNAPRPGRGRKHGEGAGVVVAEKKRTRKAR